jgi:hypothetical protein
MKYIIHTGTGTIIEAGDDVLVLDTANLNDLEMHILTEGDDSDIVDLARDKNDRLSNYMNDLRWGNCIAYSPTAIRQEVAEQIFEAYMNEDEQHIIKWVLEEATDADLNQVAEYILNDDSMWVSYNDDLVNGLRYCYKHLVGEK